VLKSWKFGAILVLVFLLISVVFLLPNVVTYEGTWKKYLPSEKIHLGLDLKGGMQLLLALDTDKLMQHMYDRKFDQLKDGMIRENIRFIGLDKMAGSISLVIKADQKEKLYNLLGKELPDMKVDTTKAEGENLFLKLNYSEKEIMSLKDNGVNQALETIRNRIDQFGVTEPVIVKQGANEIAVQLPGIKDPQRALELIGKTAQLEFKLVDEENAARAGLGTVPEGDELLMLKSKNRETGVTTTTPILVKKQTLLTGDMLSDARVKIDSGGGLRGAGETYVALEFNGEGARIFDKVTGENVNKRIAIVLDNTVYSAPAVRERISGGKASITGGFSPEEARDLSIVLRAGALPAPVTVVYNQTIGPALGQDSINKGFYASVVALVLILLFMVYYYKASGIVADAALFLNLVFLLAAMVVVGATMTLPGIAGIILTMGMGVDTNVLIFERIREELRLGKTVRAAVDSGYSKAFLTIIDSHITTLITTFILFIFGTGPIKGFAVTLSTGIIINLITAVFGSKTIFNWIIEKYKPRSLSI
jgi:preprotein translocase subunit SecD